MNDDEKSKVLPTRHSDSRPDGGAMGAATERQMRGSVPDTNSFNTRFRTNADGSTTRLRTRGGMCEYVTEQLPTKYGETTCKMNLDSGVVDMLDASFLGTADHDHSSGILYRTEYVQQVVAGPVGGETGPVIGEIKPPKTAGTAPDDGQPAQSFLATPIDSPYDKKRMAILVPPSIFTGKMRLYVQALYGRHDHAEMLRPVVTSIGQSPALYMDWTKQFGTEENPVSGSVVVIDTNCGIYLDKTTGEHSLIKVAASYATIYKMSVSACVKSLRPAMLSVSTPPGDKERIEAYILSQSKPDITSEITVSLPYSVPTKSMGYGWHFNWDGDKADIVVNYIVSASGGGYENASYHYRISFSKQSPSEWTADTTIVEGPVRWKSLRNVHAIASPLWEGMVLEKFGARTGPLPYGDAPFYVFYTGNDIKVCRYNASTGYHDKQGVVREPYYYAPNTRDAIGTDVINHRTREAYTGSVVSLSCGGSSVSYNDSTYIENVETRTQPDPANIKFKFSFGPSSGYLVSVSNWSVGQPTYVALTTVGDAYWGNISVAQGTYGDWVTESFGPYPSYRLDYGEIDVYVTVEIFTSTITKQSAFIAAIPFYDAEAVFLYGEQTTSEHEVGSSDYGGVDAFGFSGLWEDQSILATYGKMTSTSSIGLSDVITTAIDRTRTSVESAAVLICNYGVVNMVDIPGKAGFWSASDFVAQTYPTLTSAAGEAVKADDNGVLKGMREIENPISFVGWA